MASNRSNYGRHQQTNFKTQKKKKKETTKEKNKEKETEKLSGVCFHLFNCYTNPN